ncbi:MAG: SLC13 family permease [Oceanococcus sp.]
MQALFVLTLTLAVFAALVTTRHGPDRILMLALAILAASGVVEPAALLSGFANTGLATVAFLYVIAAGIRNTGGVSWISSKVLGQPKSELNAQLRLMLPVTLLSGVMNNTPIVATLIPAVSTWSKRTGIAVSKLLIPLSYAAILGGTLTMIGTSTNLVTNGLYQSMTGDTSLGMFSITPIGIAIATAGLFYMLLIGRHLLPSHEGVADSFGDPREYSTEMIVIPDGGLVGKTIADAGLRDISGLGLYLVEIVRDDGVVSAVSREERLQANDRLIFVGDTRGVLQLQEVAGLKAFSPDTVALSEASPERKLVEVVLSQSSPIIGQTIGDSDFRKRYGAVVIGVAREGRRVDGHIGKIRLQAADTLLLETRPAFLSRQKYNRDFLLVTDTETHQPNRDGAKRAGVIVVAVIFAASTGLTDIFTAALVGAMAMVVTRCLSFSQARSSLDSQVLLTIACAMALGVAIRDSGAAALVSDAIFGIAGNTALALLIASYLMTLAMSELITNNAAAALALPIVLGAAEAAGLPPQPFVLTVMVAASAAFATPLGYQTNLMIYGPGSYRFTDFLRIGLPLNFICFAVGVSVIYAMWF